MSGGFLPLDDLEPTLSDVLAFIDTFDSDATTSTSSSSSDDGNNSPRVASDPQNAVDRRKTRKAAASRRCQHKKRAELLALRAQVTALESRLRELKAPHSSNNSLIRTLDSRQKRTVTQLWRDKAKLQQQLRLQSEQRNKQLLAVVARQSQVAQAVKNVLGQVTAVVHLEEALRTPPPTNTHNLDGFVPNLNDAIYGELAARLGKLYVDVDKRSSTLEQIQIKDLSTGVQVRRDGKTGNPYVELNLVMTTNLDVCQTEKLVMNIKACHYNKFRKYLSELGAKKETEYEIRDEERAVALNSLSLGRSHDDEDRKMYTFSSLVCDHPTNSSMRFHEEGFLLVTKSPTNPLGGTVVQTFYRLTPDVSSESFSSISPSSKWGAQDAEAMKLFVLQNVGTRMWNNFQTMQAACIEAQLNPAAIFAS